MKTINTLRETLFQTMEKLENKQIDISHAKAINEVAQTIINSARLEHDYLKLLADNNKHVDKKQPVVSHFINAEPIDVTLKAIENSKKEPYKFADET